MVQKTVSQILKEAEDVVKKGINTTSLDGGTGTDTLTTRQFLDAAILSIADRQTPFRDIVKREDGEGAAVVYNLRQSLFSQADNANPRETFYGDGGLPLEMTTEYFTRTVSYKALGYKGSVTGLSKAQARSLTNLLADEVEATTRRVVQAEEWLAFYSRTDIANSQALFGFAGLDELITTNVVDANGAPISKVLVDKAAELVRQYGGMVTDMFCSIRTGININNIYNGNERVVVNMSESRQDLTWGQMIGKVSTVAGMVSIRPDFFINPGNTYPDANGASSSPSGQPTSTVFLLAMPHISFVDLQKIGMEELARVADRFDFFVNEYTVLKLKAEPWCAKIINVDDTIQEPV